MPKLNFTEKYYQAEKDVRECTDKLNALLDGEGKKVLSLLLKSQNIILGEQITQRMYEGWCNGVQCTKDFYEKSDYEIVFPKDCQDS